VSGFCIPRWILSKNAAFDTRFRRTATAITENEKSCRILKSGSILQLKRDKPVSSGLNQAHMF
jgi:hypothetical protein